MEPKASPCPLTSTHMKHSPQRLPFLLATLSPVAESAAPKSSQAGQIFTMLRKAVAHPKYFKLKKIHFFPLSLLECAF